MAFPDWNSPGTHCNALSTCFFKEAITFHLTGHWLPGFVKLFFLHSAYMVGGVKKLVLLPTDLLLTPYPQSSSTHLYSRPTRDCYLMFYYSLQVTWMKLHKENAMSICSFELYRHQSWLLLTLRALIWLDIWGHIGYCLRGPFFFFCKVHHDHVLLCKKNLEETFLSA